MKTVDKCFIRINFDLNGIKVKRNKKTIVLNNALELEPGDVCIGNELDIVVDIENFSCSYVMDYHRVDSPIWEVEIRKMKNEYIQSITEVELVKPLSLEYLINEYEGELNNLPLYLVINGTLQEKIVLLKDLDLMGRINDNVFGFISADIIDHSYEGVEDHYEYLLDLALENETDCFVCYTKDLEDFIKHEPKFIENIENLNLSYAYLADDINEYILSKPEIYGKSSYWDDFVMSYEWERIYNQKIKEGLSTSEAFEFADNNTKKHTTKNEKKFIDNVLDNILKDLRG